MMMDLEYDDQLGRQADWRWREKWSTGHRPAELRAMAMREVVGP
jgi:hypothetical protein